MNIVLKSVSTTRSLLKFTQYANSLYSKKESSSLLKKKILPVNLARGSQYTSASSELSRIDIPKKPPQDKPKQKAGSRYLKERDIYFLVEKIKSIFPLTYSQSCIFLKSCSQISYTEPPEVRLKLLNLVWETLKQSGTEFDIFHYNILLGLYVDNEHKFSYEEFLCELESKGIEPNEITYRRLLQACCQQGDMLGATALLKKIQGGDIPVNELIFNTIVYGYCQANDIGGALGVISLMERKNMQPSSDTYTHLLCAYAKNGNIEEMKKILYKCEELKIKIEDTQFLEVIYNLVVSGHNEHVYFILPKIHKSYMFIPAALKIIYRVFFQKMDTAAFFLYNIIFREKRKQEHEFFRTFFLDQLSKNKSPEEIFKTCKLLIPPGELNMAISGILKKMLLEADLEKVRNFLLVIQKNDFPIRTHYLWPLITKASEHGNHEICNVLNIMNELGLKPCFDTISLVLRHFHFENSVSFDIALLAKYKMINKRIFQELLFKYLEKNQFEKALSLSSSKRFEKPYLPLANFLDEQNATYIVRIFYNLLHDEYLNFLISGLKPGNDLIIKTALESCNKKLKMFVEDVVEKKSENVVLALLKELHKYPVKISPETVSLIKEKFHGNRSEIENACEALSFTTEEENPIKLNDVILKNKKKLALTNYGLQKTLNQDLPSAEKYFEKLGDAVTEVDIISMMTFYLRHNNVEGALKLLEKLKNVKEETWSASLLKNRCDSLIRELLNIGNEEALNKVLEVLKELNLYVEKNYYLTYIKFLIEKGEMNKAIDFYCNKLKKLNTKGYGLVLDSLIEANNLELFNKVVNALVDAVGTEALKIIFFNYVRRGRVKEAKKFLSTNNPIVGQKSLASYCKKFLKEENETALLCLLEFADDFNVKSVLWSLLTFYVKRNKPKKIKKLNLIIQDKNILIGSKFHTTLKIYLEKIHKQLPLAENTVENFREMKSQNNKLGPKIEIKNDDLNLVDLIEKGQLEGIITDSDPTTANKLYVACSQCLNNKNSDTYITVLEKAFETNPKLFQNLILTENMYENLTKDQLKKVLEWAILSLEKKQYMPLRKMLIVCLRNPQLLETLDKEIDDIFSDKLHVKVVLATKIINGFKNKKLSQNTRSLGYSIFIYININYNLEESLKYLEEAVKEGIGHLLNKKVLKLLQNELNENQKNFPYPNLLN